MNADTGLRDALTALADEMRTRPKYPGTMPGVRLHEGQKWADRLYAITSQHRWDVPDCSCGAPETPLAAHPAPQTVDAPKHYDRRDNLTWHHDDGTPCLAFWSDRPEPGGGAKWWCTEHQQSLHVAPPVTVTDAMVERAAKTLFNRHPISRGMKPWEELDDALRVKTITCKDARAALTAALTEDKS